MKNKRKSLIITENLREAIRKTGTNPFSRESFVSKLKRKMRKEWVKR